MQPLDLLQFCAVSLAVAAASASPLAFTVLGDWGGQDDAPYATLAESRIAATMGKVASSVTAQFTVALGDNFYDYGVKDVHDPRFNETFEVCTSERQRTALTRFSFKYFHPLLPCPAPLQLQDVFTAPSLQHRWYALAGNHDHYGNASAQVAYTKLSKRWFFPAFYYTETVSLSGGGTLQFVFIDTVLLCGQTHPTLRHLPPTGPASTAAAEDQWAWIEQTLSASTADWLIVAGHYPGQCEAEYLHCTLYDGIGSCCCGIKTCLGCSYSKGVILNTNVFIRYKFVVV